MSDAFDLNKLKESAGDFMGSLKSMINPGGSTPNVDPDDALGVKIAQITTLLKQMSDAQEEHARNIIKVNELLKGAFQDIEALRAAKKAEKPSEKSAEPVVSKPADTEKK